MPQLEVEDVIGRANVLQEFQIKDKKTLVSVAGSRVVNGKISRSATVKVMRGVECVYHGDLVSLKHLKDEVSEIVQNQGRRWKMQFWESFGESMIIVGGHILR